LGLGLGVRGWAQRATEERTHALDADDAHGGEGRPLGAHLVRVRVGVEGEG